jgi:probable rRNA maturation factor
MKNLQVNLSNNFKLSKRAVHNLVNELKNELNIEISSFIINFVTEEEIIDINNRFLGHNFSTDIITFNYSDSSQNIDGELYISYKEAEHNASKFRVSLKEELSRLIIHGILHLIGYDDVKKSDKLVMKRLENKLLNKFKIPLVK